MERRRLIRLEVDDFLEITPLNESANLISARSKNFSLMGICFSSFVEWRKGQVLLIDYFLPEALDSVKLKLVVIWSEYIGEKEGYFCGGEIIDVEKDKEEKFAHYYLQKLKEKFFKNE
jgi:hypothetical protein